MIVACACAGPVLAQDKVPLSLELPKPLFVGTPRPISLPNLEKPRTGPRPPMMVPAGTVLLSKGKTVTASDAFPVIGELAFVTDGEKTGADGTFVEFGPGVQWVQIDLGAWLPYLPSPSGISMRRRGCTTMSSCRCPMIRSSQEGREDALQ